MALNENFTVLVLYPDGRLESRKSTIAGFKDIVGSQTEGTSIGMVGKFEKLALFYPEGMAGDFNEKATVVYQWLKYRSRKVEGEARGICILVDDDEELTVESWALFEERIRDKMESC